MRSRFVAGCLLAGLVTVTTGACGVDHSVHQYNVQATCKDIVSNQMKNPSTIDFSDESQSSTSAGGVAVAENAFGEIVTFNYRCRVSGGTVTLDALNKR